MPELPEVEAARRAIEENCLNKRIVKAIIADDTKVIDGVSPSDFEAAVVGKTIVAARRKGKNLWLHLDSPPFPTFQFGMAGAVYIKGVAVTKYKRSAVSDTDDWPSKYSKFFIQLDDGLEMSFTDKRRFAKVRLLKDPTIVPPISELGPDALLEPMPEDEFTKCLSKKKTSIKALLLDQGFVSGIGNWVADEVLYQAKIHPLQTAASLSKESCATLLGCIKEVIKYAVEVRAESSCFPVGWLFHYRWNKKPGAVDGKILICLCDHFEYVNWFSQVIEKAVEVGADSSQYPSNWIFHSREKKPGKAFVDGKKIDFITAGGRTSAYVPELQKLTGSQATEKQSSKRKKGEKQEDDEADEPVSEEEENQEMAKPKNRLSARGGGKKPPRAGKSKGSRDHDSDDDAGSANESEDDDDQKKKKTVKTKKAQKTSTEKVVTKKTRQPKKAK